MVSGTSPVTRMGQVRTLRLYWSGTSTYNKRDFVDYRLVLRTSPRKLIMALPVTFPPLFNIYHSAATQCGPFSVTWVAAGSSVLSGPPFTLLILPFDAEPIALQLPDSSYDTTRRAGSFTLNRLWLEKGTQFIISMDDTTDLRSGALFSAPKRFQDLLALFSQKVELLEMYP